MKQTRSLSEFSCLSEYNRLYSTLLSSAYRIHISEDLKVFLDDLTGYRVQYRGEVELKVRPDFLLVDLQTLLL